MKPWLILINDFAHDLFTGLWFGSFVTLLVLRGRMGDAALLAELTSLFTWLCLGSLLAIAASGMFRYTYYRDWDSTGMAEIKKRLLQIKHALLGGSMLLGSALVVYWAV
jgi:hypothetical protein